MIKFENHEVLGWEHAIRGMRNPLNSWEKSDSLFIDSDGDYYDILLTNKVDEALAIYQDTSLYDMILDGRDSAVRMMKNPIYL